MDRDVPAIIIRDDNGTMVSAWVIGIYDSEELCKYKVVRALRTSGGVEWEYADGQGVDADVFPITEPSSWLSIEE
jgi:hypothetical protein